MRFRRNHLAQSGFARSLAIGFSVSLLSCCIPSTWANPNTSAPAAPLSIRPVETNSQLLDRLVQLDTLARRTLEELNVEGRRRAPTQREIEQVGRVAMALVFEEHFALRLSDRSEAAGFDYQARARELAVTLRKVVAEFKGSGGVRMDEIERDMRAVHDVALRQLPALASRAASDGGEPVEQELVQIMAELRRHGVWLDDMAVRYYRPFTEPLAKVRTAASAARQQALREELTELAGQSIPKYEELTTRLATAAEELKANPTTDWQGEALSGPELVPRVIEAWQTVNLQTQRTRMLLLAARGSATAVPESLTELTANHAAFTQRMIDGLAAVVAADAARVAPQHARGMYVAYLDRLSRAALWCDRQAVLASWAPPLTTIADKDPALKRDVQNYVRATGELLRWRRELVEIRVGNRTKVAPSIQSVFYHAIRGAKGPGLLRTDALVSQAGLLNSSPAVLPVILETTGGRVVTARDIVGLGAGKSVSVYQSRFYTRMTLPYSPVLELHIDALRAMLLITPTQGPLSLEAAISLAATEEGRYLAVGGTVSDATLEPLLTRFATLPDRSRGILLLKPLPEERETSELRDAVLARFDIEPQWVAHEAFITELAARPAPSTTPVAASPQPMAQPE